MEVGMTDQPWRIEEGLLKIRSDAQDAHFVSLHGEMDMSNANTLENEFIRVETTGVSRIVLDLSELEFIDSTGLAVILRAHERAKRDGHVLRVLRPNGQVGRVFEICDLDEVLAFGN
jgi:anti-sigma B factor antagonist